MFIAVTTEATIFLLSSTEPQHHPTQIENSKSAPRVAAEPSCAALAKLRPSFSIIHHPLRPQDKLGRERETIYLISHVGQTHQALGYVPPRAPTLGFGK